jgi:crescentin
MAKLTDIFGMRDSEPGAEAAAPVAGESLAQIEGSDAPRDPSVSAEPFKESRPRAAEEPVDTAGAKIGEENEALRNLLVDAGMKIRQFDEYKAYFSKLIEPVTLALKKLEQEKTSNIELRRRLEQATTRADELRARTHSVETKHAILIGENEKLRRELDLSRLEARDAERSRAEFASENLTTRSTMADFERQLALETSRVNMLTDDNHRLRDETMLAEEKASRFSAELSAARDRITFLEGEAMSLQKSLDQVSEQATHAARRFTDAETALTTAKTRLLQLEASTSELLVERDRLRVALESNSNRHGSETGRVQMQVDAVRARAAAAEKLLTEARHLLAQRGDEIRSADQRASEAVYERDKAEQRIADLEASFAQQQAELTEIKSGRDRLIEKSTHAVNALKLRETQLQRAEESAKGAVDRAARLEAEIRESGEASQRRIDQLVSALQRERLDHEVTEGALESARNERDQIQADLLRLQMDANRRAVNENADDVTFPTHGANAA